MAGQEVIHRQCNLCEAHCGVKVSVDGPQVLSITGDADDPMSRGYICPKATALADLYTDPDRLRRPVRRTASGWEEIGWAQALDLAAAGLRRVAAEHGRRSVGMYVGNPSVHTKSIAYIQVLRHALHTPNFYTAASVDQMPQYLVSAEMFGNHLMLPVPDVDRTDQLLIFGANPVVSNGSLMTAPGMRDRIKEIRRRGGRVIVVDPRRTETAKVADEHVSIRPGGDTYLLVGMLHVLFADDMITPGRLADHSTGLDAVRDVAKHWPPERAAAASGVDAATIQRLARDFAAAPHAVAYGRVGVCHQTTGTLTHWLLVLLNALTGNLDEPGGSMFTTPAVDVVALVERGLGKVKRGRYRSRVSGLPEFQGELPVATLAEDILTPGKGRIRAMVLFAGNPVLSTPGGRSVDEALDDLDFCVAIDPYVTESTRHADVILPPVSPLERDEIDVVFSALSVRNHIRFSPAAVPVMQGGREDWQILVDLATRLDTGPIAALTGRGMRWGSRLLTPERLIDLAIRTGPYGSGQRPGRWGNPIRAVVAGLSLRQIQKAPHGVDLGPLQSRLPAALRTPDRVVHLAPQEFVDEIERLAAAVESDGAASDGNYDLILIGRRQLRSNNSWMHNSERLVKGRDRCTALMHPGDARARDVRDGDTVRVSSVVGAIEVPVEISDEMRPGVVSIPHGWGHDRPGVGWRTAAAHPGASVNDVTDPRMLDRLSGNAALNATRVKVEAGSHARA